MLMILGHVKGVVQFLEQPAHHATGGMESLPRFRSMGSILTVHYSAGMLSSTLIGKYHAIAHRSLGS